MISRFIQWVRDTLGISNIFYDGEWDRWFKISEEVKDDKEEERICAHTGEW